MFLDYLSLFILLAGLTLVFYGFIYIHDLPHKIAEKRHHPHEEAIHVACWLSLLTLHAMWPFIYIWACMHAKTEEDAAKGKVAPFSGTRVGAGGESAVELGVRLGRLEQKLKMAGLLDTDGN
ncbi:MAG TPA: DUF3302 domain-containing protein [Gemmataceae bacterium]|jgi:hypothetical protein|nr:DUF3302 domain-containing protein [Gemmataceae bacterium]